MYWRERPPADVAAYEAASTEFSKAVAARDKLERGSAAAEAAQTIVMAQMNEMSEAQAYYFRLNIWGMSDTVDVMVAHGMLCQPEKPSHAEWDALPPYDNDHPDANGGPEHQAAHDVLARAHRGECPGIPIHKFCSNDGWIVTPAEIRAALAQADRVSEPAIAIPEWWEDWLNWMKLAADHDGFEVY